MTSYNMYLVVQELQHCRKEHKTALENGRDGEAEALSQLISLYERILVDGGKGPDEEREQQLH